MIVAAAVRINHCVCSMQAPARHHEILRQINGLYNPQSRPLHTYDTQTEGFLTDKGEFLGRREAMQHALECGQGIPRRVARNNPTDYHGPELFSEDLW